MHMVEYRRNQRLLQETPKSISRHYQTAPDEARRIAQDLIASGHNVIDLNKAAPLLNLYGLNSLAHTPCRLTRTSGGTCYKNRISCCTKT